MFDWTPEGRVLKRLKLTEKVISDSMQCVMDCNNFGEKEWKRLLKDGDVNFAQAREKPYAIYTVQLKNDQKEMIHQLSFLAKDSISVIIDFKGLRKECQCE